MTQWRQILAVAAAVVVAAVALGTGAAYLLGPDDRQPPSRPVVALSEPAPDPGPAAADPPAAQPAPEPRAGEQEEREERASPAAAPAPPSAPEGRSPALLRVGTGHVVGAYYPAGGALCRLMNDASDRHGIYCAVEATAGSVENLERLRAGTLDVAVVQSDWQYHAQHGTTEFSGAGPDPGLRALFALHGEPLTVVVRREAGIRSFPDLRGKRVNLGPAGSGQRIAMDVALSAFELSREDFAAVGEQPFAEQVLELCANRVDAVAFAVGHPSGSVMDATATCGGLIIPVGGGPLAPKLEELPYLARLEVPGGFYPGNAGPVHSFGVMAVLVTRDTVPEAAVLEFVTAAFGNLERLRTMHPALEELDPEQMIRAGLTAPLHAAAEGYYRGRGWLGS